MFLPPVSFLFFSIDDEERIGNYKIFKAQGDYVISIEIASFKKTVPMFFRCKKKIPPDWAGFFCAGFARFAGFTLPFPYSERALVSTTRYSLTVRVWSAPRAFAAVRS
jgi:hypothetical protein